jgi:hypothetical protein
MKFTSEQVSILKTLSKINEQMYFTSNTLGLSSNDKNCIVYYDWDVIWKKSFGIYDMKSFLSVLSLYKEPELIEEETNIIIKEGREKTTIKHTSKQCIICPPDKETIFTSINNQNKLHDTFKITKDEMSHLLLQTNVLKTQHIVFNVNEITSLNKNNSAVTNFTLQIEGMNSPEKTLDRTHFVNMRESSYTVKIMDNVVIFTDDVNKITYIFSLVI